MTVSTYNDIRSAISKAEKAGGGKIYVKGTKIACDGQLALSKTNANVQIIGVQNADGSYPELDFSNFMAKYIGKASSDAAVGVRISGSNYSLQNLIIEHAPDNGIQIKGKSAGNNKISNCIVRYNNDAGLQVTAGAYQNTIEAVYSYRNCDVYTVVAMLMALLLSWAQVVVILLLTVMLGIILMMVGILLTKQGMLHLILLTQIVPFGTMVIPMSLLGNMILIIKMLWMKIFI